MTGRELIIYILSNGLEDRPVFDNGKFIGFITVPEAAIKMGVGINTIYALIKTNQINYIHIDNTYLIMEDLTLKTV